MLAVRGLTVHYGRVRVLDQVDLDVQTGEIVALIGANGAGKTTLLKAVAGLVSPTDGQVSYGGQSLAGVPAYARARRGLVLVPEGRGVLTALTVTENLLMGAQCRPDGGTPERRARAVLERFPGLAARSDLPAGVLSGGERQLLAIARAQLANPRLLLLDEPSLGLAPRFVQQVFDLIAALRREGTTILLVEQHTAKALAIADRAYVLQTGRVVLSGDARALRDDSAVQGAYLGG